MNFTNFVHGFYAAVIQVLVAAATGSWLAGACAGIAFFVGREHAQREMEIALEHGLTVSYLSPLDGFTGWDTDRRLDALVSALVCLAIWWVA